MAASATPGAQRCRSLLVDLLRPFGSGASGWADRLVGEFGSLAGVLAAGPLAQRRVIGNERSALAFLGTVRTAMLHTLRAEALKGPVLGNSEAVIDYLFASMAHEPVEQLRVLYLNTKNRLLQDETVIEGSINVAPIYPREIMRRSLEIGATALILAHNHPSGDPKPSSDDIRVTRLVAAAAAALDIRLHDHVIVARSGWISFSATGLL